MFNEKNEIWQEKYNQYEIVVYTEKIMETKIKLCKL